MTEEAKNRDFLSTNPEDWIETTLKLRQINKDLLVRISQLESALGECRSEFQLQQQKAQAQDSLLLQQNQELNEASEQVNILFKELESSHYVAQKQQVLIESMNKELEDNLVKIHQLETECAEIQKQYQLQAHTLIETEKNAKILNDKLQQQQKYTLQFQAALTEYLQGNPEKPNLHNQSVIVAQEWSNQDQQNLELVKSLMTTNSMKPTHTQLPQPETKTETETKVNEHTPVKPQINQEQLINIAVNSTDVTDMIDQIYAVIKEEQKNNDQPPENENQTAPSHQESVVDETNINTDNNLPLLLSNSKISGGIKRKNLTGIELPKLPQRRF
ncbi:MAG TPA: hypothetical protein V6C58_04865 [Allocoleopsis sp.]